MFERSCIFEAGAPHSSVCKILANQARHDVVLLPGATNGPLGIGRGLWRMNLASALVIVIYVTDTEAIEIIATRSVFLMSD